MGGPTTTGGMFRAIRSIRVLGLSAETRETTSSARIYAFERINLSNPNAVTSSSGSRATYKADTRRLRGAYLEVSRFVLPDQDSGFSRYSFRAKNAESPVAEGRLAPRQ
ncbi:hypothetical protein RF11_01584 [Thelohanellus kitauei]|uniref:Uncharacterized protein n=1 Tax=Thelohanellus kitauei TaxID=669202 RepID=A0A0C2N960_THEKT|nr:hypothetical protein RF11_01584 [Thelohanellus kitauei]